MSHGAVTIDVEGYQVVSRSRLHVHSFSAKELSFNQKVDNAWYGANALSV